MHEFASTLVSDSHDFDEVRDNEVDGIEEIKLRD